MALTAPSTPIYTRRDMKRHNLSTANLSQSLDFPEWSKLRRESHCKFVDWTSTSHRQVLSAGKSRACYTDVLLSIKLGFINYIVRIFLWQSWPWWWLSRLDSSRCHFDIGVFIITIRPIWSVPLSSTSLISLLPTILIVFYSSSSNNNNYYYY